MGGAPAPVFVVNPFEDLEETVVSLEYDADDKWGGELLLGDGEKYYVEPLPERPDLPKTMRAKRVND